jgi:transposase-like protein
VRLVREADKPIAQVARELGIKEGTLGNWVDADRPSAESRTLTSGWNAYRSWAMRAVMAWSSASPRRSARFDAVGLADEPDVMVSASLAARRRRPNPRIRRLAASAAELLDQCR